jgi:hypothetical protein
MGRKFMIGVIDFSSFRLLGIAIFAPEIFYAGSSTKRSTKCSTTPPQVSSVSDSWRQKQRLCVRAAVSFVRTDSVQYCQLTVTLPIPLVGTV